MENTRLVQKNENLVQENKTFRGDLEQAEVRIEALKVYPNPRP